ncbi:hypothetical protein Ddye_027380 [Dipteronia dyeriana]|uniref:PGG domain-containing protein n=1 Tax=Dipteronia dyeriana TaxID=168575 RepID=A0AAD9WRF2_9ROSI|nr:hypothetical protein Ddye_027380 [Dipteronia dyeriana]
MDQEWISMRRELKFKNGNGIMKLAKEKPDLFRARSPQGNTTLHIASRSGNKSVVQEIINIQPCLVFERNQRGETPLHIAAAAGDVNVVKLLICKMKIDKEIGQKNILRMQDSEDNTPLHMAVSNRHLKVVQELINLDTEPGFPVNKAGQSPLSIAIDANSTNIARWIIRNRPDSLNYEGSNNMTLLHIAVMRRNIDVTREILNAKKDLLTKMDVKQRNALHYAAAAANEVKNIVALLSKEDDLLAYKRDCNGQTPIHLATKNGRFGVVKMLVNDYPDVIEVLDNKQRNILHLAAQHGHGYIVSFIIKLPEKDDLLNMLDEDGNTPLHLAAMNFCDNVVDTLSREIKLNVMAKNHNQQTALDIAQTSDVEATENKKYLTLKALKETYKYRALDPDDIIANGCLSGSGTSRTDDQGKIERAKKLAEVVLTLTSIVAAFTLTAALTIPEKYNYQRDPEQNVFLPFMVCIALSSTSCLSAAIIICLLFWRYSNHHEYFIKRLYTALGLTILGLITMALAFILGVFVVLSSNHTIPMSTVWSISILPLIYYVYLPTYFWLSTSFLERKEGVYFVD